MKVHIITKNFVLQKEMRLSEIDDKCLVTWSLGIMCQGGVHWIFGQFWESWSNVWNVKRAVATFMDWTSNFIDDFLDFVPGNVQHPVMIQAPQGNTQWKPLLHQFMTKSPLKQQLFWTEMAVDHSPTCLVELRLFCFFLTVSNWIPLICPESVTSQWRPRGDPNFLINKDILGLFENLPW